jgi:hypothetical protein
MRDVGAIPEIQMTKISESTLQEINPGRFLLPIIKDVRDIEAISAIFRTKTAWPLAQARIRYTCMFHMAADSERFNTIAKMEELGGYPADASRWVCSGKSLIRLFEGKMIQAFDHRAASSSFYESNIFRTGEGVETSDKEHADPTFLATPRFYVELREEDWKSPNGWALAVKDITSTTNTRSTICAIIPKAGSGHTLPILFERDANVTSHLLCANLNSFALDFVTRTKIQGNHLTWNILEDLPVIRPEAYSRLFGSCTAAALVKDHVLRLTYTAYDMEQFARDMGYVDADGSVKPPITWSESERRHLRARIDALYFILYGVTDEDDVRYILSTFPIVERKDRKVFQGVYLTRELIIWYKRALEAGNPSALAPEAEVIRLAKSRLD